MSEKPRYNPAKTKVMLAAPLLFIPFAAIFFFALGGGTGTKKEEAATAPQGLNTILPSPKLKEGESDKLSLYQADDKDSSHRKKRDRHSMNLFDRMEDSDNASSEEEHPSDGIDDQGRVASPFSGSGGTSTMRHNKARRANEADPADELERKLAALQKALDEEPVTQQLPQQKTLDRKEPDEQMLQQLEATMAAIQQNTNPVQSDPELNVMNGMLDKVLDIQHPTRVRDRIEKAKSPEEKGMRVAPTTEPTLIDALPATNLHGWAPMAVSASLPQSDGFFELDTDTGAGTDGVSASIAAVVHGSQRLVSGATMKVRIEQDIYVNRQLVPKGAFIYGKCSLSGDRVQVSFTSIRHGQYLLPVRVTAYGLDGLPGIAIPGSINRDAAKQGTNEAIQAITMGTLDPSLGAQATAAGIDAAKNLLTRKVKLIRFTIKADYPILLVDNSNAK